MPILVGTQRVPLLGSQTRADRTRALGPIQYLRLNELAGTTVLDSSGNGRHAVSSGTSLGVPGLDGTAHDWDAVNDHSNLYSASLAAAFSGARGSISLWAKVSATGVWTDATGRYLIHLAANTSSNFASVFRTATNNTIFCRYAAGGTVKTITLTTSTLAWFHVGVTWDKDVDAFIATLNGVQVGATQTGLGTWAGALLAGNTTLGAFSTAPTSVWSGSIDEVSIYDRALSPSAMASLARTS